jgi:alpha-1,3-mannosyltransferase
LIEHPYRFSNETEVIFLNDVALCSSDILELIHQKRFQVATMTCGIDWDAERNSFYDVWIARGMSGDSFFHIPDSGSWDEASNLFWNDQVSKRRLEASVPFQVFSCWNGGVVFSASVLLAEDGKEGVRFRAHKDSECHQGEPQLFCKDLWYYGHGRIAVVPSVNFGYSDADAKKIKKKRGTVERWVARESTEREPLKIEWKKDPPAEVKCIDNWANQFWRSWDEGLRIEEANPTVNGSRTALGSGGGLLKYA